APWTYSFQKAYRPTPKTQDRVRLQQVPVLSSDWSDRRDDLCVSGLTRLADVCLNDPVCIYMSGPAPSDILTSDPSPAGQSESFALPEALKQFVVTVPSKIRLVCLAAFILDKCKFSQDQKLIVFISSCEAVEFLHFLFSSVLSEPLANQKAEFHFLRLHGNMKQEVRKPCDMSHC
ncbi:probable ATP-dependent RNA helicase DDX31, partial [Thalassophryne amazonica]|uniref:probable ATP-dependent RNA helicase DDX31 n=1 Tax=Thalassophryne amazonica TaxID=390379 RepID=UPI0014718187